MKKIHIITAVVFFVFTNTVIPPSCLARNANADQQGANTVKGKIFQPSEQMADLTRMAMESNRKLTEAINLFMTESQKSLTNVPQVKRSFKQYVDNVTKVLENFEDSSPLMMRINNLKASFTEEQRRLNRKAKDNPERKDQFLNLADTYDEHGKSIGRLRDQLQTTRRRGQDAVLKLVEQEDFIIEIIRAGQAVRSVEALESVARAFQQSISDTEKVVKKIVEDGKKLQNNKLPR